MERIWVGWRPSAGLYPGGAEPFWQRLGLAGGRWGGKLQVVSSANQDSP